MENKQLTTVKSFDEIKELGNVMSASGYFDKISGAQAITKILLGQSLGLSPAVAMTGINVIKGKPELSVHVMAGLVKASGKYNYKIIESTDTCCKIEYFEQGESIGVSEFNKEDAVSFGLAGKDNFQKHPEEMMYARAMSKGAKRFCPDVFLVGVYAENEISDAIETKPVEKNITPPQYPTAHRTENMPDELIEQIEETYIKEQPKEPEPTKEASPPPGALKEAFDTDNLEMFEQWLELYPDNEQVKKGFDSLLECLQEPTDSQLLAEERKKERDPLEDKDCHKTWVEVAKNMRNLSHKTTYKIRGKYQVRFKCEINWKTDPGTMRIEWMLGQIKRYSNTNLENEILETFEVVK